MNAEGIAILQGKRALVSGGTRGMGAATAGELARLGARVIVVARTLPEGAGHGSVAADAATPAGARAIAEAVTREFGGVDGHGSIVSRLMRPSRSVNLNCRSATPPGKLPSR